jgi:hypothetical protein
MAPSARRIAAAAARFMLIIMLLIFARISVSGKRHPARAVFSPHFLLDAVFSPHYRCHRP